MGLLDILLGRTKPVAPDLDQLFGLPSAAITLEAAAGFRPTGSGAVCFATVEGAVFEQTHREVQALLDADAEREGRPVQLTRDGYGYSWLVSRRSPEQLPELVNDLHAVNSAMEVNGFGPQLLCSLAGFEYAGGEEPDAGDRSDGSDEAERGEPRRRLALVYLYKRGTFYPFAPLPDTTEHRDNPLELRVRAALANDLRIEQDLNRWFPLWGAPGL
ncbi:PspA-associated protein PspAB [Streptomyces sp. NBC_00443]|uniref:PspA-associated protein PspAB n=1 Tax=Streptomyces sp. NBC_00443 TaxID=2975743 RepID=UPI002E2094EB